MKWTVPELLARLQELSEHDRVEAKRGLGDSVEATVSAFSNEPDLGGGWVLFGLVANASGGYDIAGVSDPDRLQAEFATKCRGVFSRVVRPEIQVATVDGKRLVGAYIGEAPAADKPVYIKKVGLPGGAFRRIGSTDQSCTDDDLAVLASRANPVSFDRRPCPTAVRSELGDRAIARFRRELAAAKPGSELVTYGDDDLLYALHAVTPRDDGVAPTNAGLLLFGTGMALRRHFPLARIDYIRVRGTEWRGDLDDTYEVVEIREPLVLAWHRAFASIMDELPMTFTLPEGAARRRDIPKLPQTVVREALVNALAHRDYEAHGATQIRRFANRIEIENPGHSLVAEEAWSTPTSRSRNPALIEAFRDLGLAEARGTGIRRMRERMQKAGLTPPLIRSDRHAGRFVVTLLFHHFLDDADLAWLGNFPDLDDTDRRILVHAREVGAVTNRDVRQFAGDDTLGASTRLRHLRDRNLLVQHGASKQDTYYELSSESLSGPASVGRGGLFDGPLAERDFVEYQRSTREHGTKSGPRSGTKSGPRSGTKSNVRSEFVEILRFASEPRAITELMALSGWSHRTRFRERFVRPLLDCGWMTMTLPEKPQSQNQRYIRTAAGAAAVVEADRGVK